MKLTGSLCFQIRFCREKTGFLFGRVSALYKGHGLLHPPAEKNRCLHGVCSLYGSLKNFALRSGLADQWGQVNGIGYV